MVFTVDLKKTPTADDPVLSAVDLPIGPYKMLDVLDKLRLHEKEAIIWEITNYHLFAELAPFMDKTGTFFELNALAERLMALDEVQHTAFAGLLAMEDAKGPIPLPHLIDLAYSTDCCHVAGGALTDSQLGRIRAENGSVPDVDRLSREDFETLDFEQLGQSARTSEKGVFVKQSTECSGGYVTRHKGLVEAHKTLDLTPRKPEYVIQACIKYDPVAGPDVDLTQIIRINLPASEEQMRDMDANMISEWLGTYLYSVDSAIPQITDAVLCVDSIPELNPLACKVAKLDPAALPAYKALLEAAGCLDFDAAEHLMDTLDQYSFHPHLRSPTDLAKEELLVITAEENARLLLPYLNLHEYGEALIKESGAVLTSYGLIERKDGQPIHSPWQKQPEGGMTLG